MCQGLGPKKHDEISEIDRIHHGLAGRADGGSSHPGWDRILVDADRMLEY